MQLFLPLSVSASLHHAPIRIKVILQKLYCKAKPFPLICGPENLRYRAGSICNISDSVVINQPSLAPDADSKDIDNFYVTGGDDFQSGAWLISN